MRTPTYDDAPAEPAPPLEAVATHEAAYGERARVLALQRSAGNRAVVQLLSRQPATATPTDPFMRRALDLLDNTPLLDQKVGGGPHSPGREASVKALRDIFARSGSAAVSPRAGRYLPTHTRAYAQELKTLLEYAAHPDVVRIDLVPSSSAQRTPDMVVTTSHPTGGPVEITTLTGAGPGYQWRGAVGAKAPTEAAIVGRVREKVWPSRGRPSQLASAMGRGGTLVVRMPYGDAQAMVRAQHAMEALARDLQTATHLEAIEFHGRSDLKLRFERQATGAYQRAGAPGVAPATAPVEPSLPAARKPFSMPRTWLRGGVTLGFNILAMVALWWLGKKAAEEAMKHLDQLVDAKLKPAVQQALIDKSATMDRLTTKNPSRPLFAHVVADYDYEWSESGIGRERSTEKFTDVRLVDMTFGTKPRAKDEKIRDDEFTFFQTTFHYATRRVTYSLLVYLPEYEAEMALRGKSLEEFLETRPYLRMEPISGDAAREFNRHRWVRNVTLIPEWLRQQERRRVEDELGIRRAEIRAGS